MHLLSLHLLHLDYCTCHKVRYLSFQSTKFKGRVPMNVPQFQERAGHFSWMFQYSSTHRISHFACAGTLGPSNPSFTNIDVRAFFPLGFCPDIGSHMVHPASDRCPEPCLFRGQDGGLWEWSDLSCHSLVGSFKADFFFLHLTLLVTNLTL
jgi:hypothetical protein